ncbi:Flagellar biosynthetic protein FliQ [Serratia plymuthica]|uniref:Flagellar biosynthetic protein FliQ n=1 Tax=Serratia plymuthica TaxID=82996 RepID=A0A2X4URI2_SERPL|nr:Flagellar biosynthetic protein FliQ [Serratia plymuthica]
MTPESVMALGTEAMKVALALSAPLLLAALVSGLVVSLLQAATQINEMTLSFIPKFWRWSPLSWLPGRGC